MSTTMRSTCWSIRPLHPLAGNLRTWPAVVQQPDVLVRAAGHRAPGAQALAQVQRYDLPGGFHLLIGRDVQARASCARC